MTELPPGYVMVLGQSVHVAALRKHTSDLPRLLRMIPFAEALMAHKPGSPGAAEFFRGLAAQERDDLAATMPELGHYQMAAAEELRALKTRRDARGGGQRTETAP